jgi:hypothetical protein
MTPEQKRLYYGIALDGVRNSYGLPALSRDTENELMLRLLNARGEDLVCCPDLRVLYRMAARGIFDPLD